MKHSILLVAAMAVVVPLRASAQNAEVRGVLRLDCAQWTGDADWARRHAPDGMLATWLAGAAEACQTQGGAQLSYPQPLSVPQACRLVAAEPTEALALVLPDGSRYDCRR